LKIPASVIVLTKNEEKNIRKCLVSVAEFSEVFVVDSGSNDATCEIAATFENTTVVQFKWNGGFPKKKQWALDNLPFSCSWVLYVDADEEITPTLVSEIRNVLSRSDGVAGYFVAYDNHFLGRRLVHGSHSMKLILFKRQLGHFDPGNEILATEMWEVEGNYQPTIDGSVAKLRNRAIHNDYKSLFHYFERHNRYSDLEALHRVDSHSVTESYPPFRRLLKALRRTPGAGVLYFLYSYILCLGFLDGRAGLAYALARLAYFIQIDCKVIELRAVAGIRDEHYLSDKNR
jgi:glycosyltransferase involved in cell wall biosynthesis